MKKIPNEIKEACFLTVLKSKIKKWVSEGCPCRLCKTYVGQVGFYIINLLIFDRNPSITFS